MTENEIKWNLDGVIKYLYKKNELGGDDSEKQYQVDNYTIDLLEELQQYRAIGTVGRFQQLTKQFKPHVTDKTSCPHRGCNKCDMYRKENEKYHEIGTVEECREARERQRGKKPILCMNEVSGMFVDYADGRGEYKTQMNNWWRCPCCNEIVGERVIVHKYIHDQRKKKFCEKCGQAILWGE